MTDKAEQILAYLEKKAWLSGELSCSFLAAGEYNENYVVSAGEQRFVFRINHGTQLGLEKQSEYEFQVLEAVAPSTVTPLPYFYDMDSGGLGRGVLLMEYLPGVPLDYRRDLSAAARIFARIHTLPPSSRLICQRNPARDIAAESHELLSRYADLHYPAVRGRLFEYHQEILAGATEMARRYQNEDFCIVNTEVNSGNFIIGQKRSCLVDWEKAVVSYRYQDLAHFLVPTTTLWKTDYRCSEEDKRRFLNEYLEAGDFHFTLDEMYEKTVMMERVILLRALSWCYMAYHEYVAADRELVHKDTFAKITSYMDEAECFLG
jgi:aminoglycoside phosphotransferase (APT) family kinase protein